LNTNASCKVLYSKHAEDVKDFKKIKDMVNQVCEINGSWLKDLYIDGVKYWDIEEDIPDR
jgi:hypothetical protein